MSIKKSKRHKHGKNRKKIFLSNVMKIISLIKIEIEKGGIAFNIPSVFDYWLYVWTCNICSNDESTSHAFVSGRNFNQLVENNYMNLS